MNKGRIQPIVHDLALGLNYNSLDKNYQERRALLKGHVEEGKCLGKMSCEPATSLGGIVEASLSDEGQNQIIDRSHDLACVSHCHEGGIFLQCDIAATPAPIAGAV
jgi:hypothetical protein